MGQKINALGLRLKNRVNWNASFCTQDLKNYSKVNYNNQQIEHTTSIIFSNFHVFPNRVTTIKNSKNYQVHSKLFQKKDIIKNTLDFQSSDRTQLLRSNKTLFKSLILDKRSVKYNLSDFFFNLRKESFNKITRKRFIMLAPKIITAYVINQLNKNGILKRSSFKNNLNVGILAFSYQLLTRLQNNILGIKIVCSGKWKKTRSGRKQKLTIKFGRIVSPSISNMILYNFSAQKTKFGTTGIKVWVAIKKTIK